MNNDLRRIVINYHFNCEHFDRIVCSSSFRDSAFPITNEERKKMMENSNFELRKAISEAKSMQVKTEDVYKTINNMAREFDYELECIKRKVLLIPLRKA